MARAGGTLIAASLGALSRPEQRPRARSFARCARHGALRFATPNRPAGTLAVADFSDPLVPTEWWRTAVGVDTLTPPPPGRAVTIVDSGIDVTHPDFLGRPNTETLNDQEPAGFGASTARPSARSSGRPSNGLGLVGIYPEARPALVGRRQGRTARSSRRAEIVHGLLTAAAAGPGVVNLSLGSDEKELAIEQAIYAAIRKGTLVVAAAGNDGDCRQPAQLSRQHPARPHRRRHRPRECGRRLLEHGHASSTWRHPASTIPIATARGKGWRDGDGTSFAAPLVSGASAWVWTVRPELDATQLFEVMRRSAVDIAAPGRDDAAGFGLLNVPAALAYPRAGPRSVRAERRHRVRPARRALRQLDSTADDPAPQIGDRAGADRPGRGSPRCLSRLAAARTGASPRRLTADANVDLSLWKQGTISILERSIGSDRLARAISPGTTERLTFANTGPGRFAFLAVYPPEGRSRGDLPPAGRARRLADQSRRRSTATAANSTGGSSTTSGLRTRTRTAVTGNSATSASAIAAVKASSRW